MVMDRIGKPAHEIFTSAVYLQVQFGIKTWREFGGVGSWVVFENDCCF